MGLNPTPAVRSIVKQSLQFRSPLTIRHVPLSGYDLHQVSSGDMALSRYGALRDSLTQYSEDPIEMRENMSPRPVQVTIRYEICGRMSAFSTAV